MKIFLSLKNNRMHDEISRAKYKTLYLLYSLRKKVYIEQHNLVVYKEKFG